MTRADAYRQIVLARHSRRREAPELPPTRLTFRSLYVLLHGSRQRLRSRAVDCLTAGCRGERVYSITALAACYDAKQTVSGVLRHMRCTGCGKPVGAAWLVTGPKLNERVRPRRVALLGSEARG